MRLYRQLSMAFILFFFALICFADTPPDNFPKQLTFNDQVWKLDNYQANKDVILAEYVLENENVQNWTQLVTIQKFNFSINNDLTPAKFAALEMEELKKQNYDVVFNNISANDNESMFEFRVKSPKEAQQNEIQRIIITPERELIVLHYVIKKEDMGDAARKTWVKNLQDLKLEFLPKG